MSYYFSSRIAKKLSAPLLELNVASQKIADGDFDQKVTAQGSGEIKSLIDNFNLMAYKLSDTTSRLTQSERVAAWRHIARRFAHELKNPLQPIMVSLYRIEKSLKESNQYEQFAEPLRAASEELKHLEELAERFSTLAKLPPPKLEKTNLNDFIKSIANLYDELLINFEFELILPDDIIISSIDAAYFREAIHNLLQNAVDASEPGGKIILKLYQDKDKISISVQDFGQGIKTDIAKSVRIPYFTTKVKGSGLGLAIVEKTVNELSGSLHIESRKGVGTKVSISLPLK